MFSFCVLFIFLNWGMQTFTLLSIEEAINEIMFWRFFLRVTQALRAFYKTNCKFVLIKLRLAYSNSGQNGIGMFIVQLGPGQNQSFGPKQNTKFGVVSSIHPPPTHPPTFWMVLGTVGGQDLVCGLSIVQGTSAHSFDPAPSPQHLNPTFI